MLEIWVTENCYLQLMFDLLYDDMNIGDANTTKKELRSLSAKLHQTTVSYTD